MGGRLILQSNFDDPPGVRTLVGGSAFHTRIPGVYLDEGFLSVWRDRRSPVVVELTFDNFVELWVHGTGGHRWDRG